MNDKDWQARAHHLLEGHLRGKPTYSETYTILLTYAKEYAAEALVEVTRLNSQVELLKREVDCYRIQFEKDYVESDVQALMRIGAENADLRAQLAAAGPVKVPADLPVPPWRGDETTIRKMCNAIGWNACIAEVIRLNGGADAQK